MGENLCWKWVARNLVKYMLYENTRQNVDRFQPLNELIHQCEYRFYQENWWTFFQFRVATADDVKVRFSVCGSDVQTPDDPAIAWSGIWVPFPGDAAKDLKQVLAGLNLQLVPGGYRKSTSTKGFREIRLFLTDVGIHDLATHFTEDRCKTLSAPRTTS